MGTTSNLRKLALSLFGQLFGWFWGYTLFVSYQIASYGQMTDVAAMRFWPLAFTIVAWILFVAPLVLQLPETSPLFQPTRYPLFGAVYGVVVFYLLVGWWTGFWKSPPFLIWPAVTGFCGGGFYALALQGRNLKILTAPLALPLSIVFIVWPTIRRGPPHLAYRFGNPNSRTEVCIEVIKNIRVGDSLSDLHQKCPKFFLDPVKYPQKDNDYLGSGGGLLDNFEYSVLFFKGNVKTVSIKERK